MRSIKDIFGSLLRWGGLLLVSGVTAPLSTAAPFNPLPETLDGTMRCVELDTARMFLIPDSLEITKGSYMSRHGARYLSSEKKIAGLEKGIREATEAGTLTPAGAKFSMLLNQIKGSSKGKWGLLSPIGKHEQEVFGQVFGRKVIARMNVDGGTHQSAVSSYVPRVVETMYIFDYNTLLGCSATTISSAEGAQFDQLTRFFTTDSLYAEYLADGEWKEVYKEFESSTLPAAPARRLLGNIPGKDDDWHRKHSLGIYGVLQSLRATGLGEPTDEWMTEEEYRACWETSNIEHYLTRSLNSLTDLAPASAIPLLRHLLEGREGEVTEVFGHAETLLPLLSLMGIPGGSYVGNDWDEVASNWNDGELSPLGANVAIMFLRSSVSGNEYIMVFHNGLAIEPIPGGSMVVPRSDYLEYLADRIAGLKPEQAAFQ